MNWKKIKEIKNVKLQPVFASNKMWTFDREDKMHVFEIETLKQIKAKYFGGNNNIKVIKNDILIYLHDSLEKINPETYELERIWKKKFGQIAYLDEKHVSEQLYDRRSENLRLAMYERNTNRLIWEKEFSKHRFARNFAHGLFLTDINFTYLIRLNLETGKESWAYSFSEGEKVQGDIYLHENALVVPSMAGQMPFDKTYLQGIEINTGELLWRRESNTYLYQDKRTSLLHAFGGEVYITIDPKNGETLVRKEFKGLRDENKLLVLSNMCRMSEDGLYFISAYVENHYNCQFGKINTESHEIDFIQKLDVAKGVNASSPIYHKGKIYIKDDLDALHIYGQTV